MNDILMNYFDLDPLFEFTDIDFSILDDGYEFYENSMTELKSQPVTKKNIIEKIWDVIKKFFNWLKTMSKKFINVITNLFKKKTKSTEQILIELGVVNRKDVEEGKVSIPSNENSTIKTESEIDLALKPLIVKFDNDGETIKITGRDVNRYLLLKNKIGYGKVPGHKHGPSMLCYLMAMNFITDPTNYWKKFMLNIAQEIKLGTLSDRSARDIDMLMNMFFGKSLEDLFSNTYSVTLSQLRDTQEILSTVCESINTIVDPNKSFNRSVRILNDFANLVTWIQMGMNQITNAIKNVYTIDPSYCETISDVETLSKFVEKCIKANIPAKYLSLNTYLISSKELKGDGDALHPIWGQFRVVFFPPDNKIAYKIALSQAGINSNITEDQAFIKLSQSNDSKLLTKVYDLTKNNCIITVERIDSSKNVSNKIVNDMKSKLKSAMNRNNINIDITQDLHTKNIGIRHTNHGDEYVALDFAAINRI